jgi:hypothetical protein
VLCVLDIEVTHAGAGAIFPLLALFVLCLPITLFWIFRGSGNFKRRRIIGFSQLAVLALSVVLFCTETGQLKNIAFVIAFVVLVSMLVTPIILKSSIENTHHTRL